MAAGLAGTGIVLSSCSSASAQPSARRVSACSLLKLSDAKNVFKSSVQSPEAASSLPNGHSECLFTPDSSSPASLVIDVSWNRKTLSQFRLVYGGHADSVPVTTPSGEASGGTIPVPGFSELTVAGDTSYWLAHPPSIGTKDYPATYNANMISEKNGYVIGLHSDYLSESQDTAALAAVLTQL